MSPLFSEQQSTYSMRFSSTIAATTAAVVFGVRLAAAQCYNPKGALAHVGFSFSWFPGSDRAQCSGP